MHKKIYPFVILLLISLNCKAQQEANESGDEYENKAHVMFGINYVSDNVYLGRKDTVALPYTSPYLGYQFNSGIYIKGIASMASRPSSHLDLFTLTGGYQHNFNDVFIFGANFDKYFFNKNTVSVKANISANEEVYAMYANEYIEPMVILDVNQIKNNKSDFILGFALDHSFSAAHERLQITPTLTGYAGTQHYYEQYKQDVVTKKGVTKVKNIIVNNADQFSVLDYEFSVPFEMAINHWAFKLIPAYIIPLNPSSVTINNVVLPEKISNTFLLELDICLRY